MTGRFPHNIGEGRDIELYKHYMSEFLQLAKNKERPFWLMLNTHDPHKPFYGDGGEALDYPVSRVYSPDEEVGYLNILLKSAERRQFNYSTKCYSCGLIGSRTNAGNEDQGIRQVG